MFFRTYAPTPPLDRFVENFWLYRGYTSPHLKERILQDGTFKMVFNLERDEFRIYDAWRPQRWRSYSGAIVSRPRGEPFVTDSAEEAHVLGVNFRIGGAFPLLGCPASETGPCHVDLSDLWGREGSSLNERLALERSPGNQFSILEGALLGRLGDAKQHHPATLAALESLGTAGAASRTREIAEKVELSQRRLITVFKREIGITPKLFARLRRFQHALTLMRASNSPTWAALAIECGYFDQSHLIRDFVAFSGLTPSEYLECQQAFGAKALRIKHNHVPLTG